MTILVKHVDGLSKQMRIYNNRDVWNPRSFFIFCQKDPINNFPQFHPLINTEKKVWTSSTKLIQIGAVHQLTQTKSNTHKKPE